MRDRTPIIPARLLPEKEEGRYQQVSIRLQSELPCLRLIEYQTILEDGVRVRPAQESTSLKVSHLDPTRQWLNTHLPDLTNMPFNFPNCTTALSVRHLFILRIQLSLRVPGQAKGLSAQLLMQFSLFIPPHKVIFACASSSQILKLTES